MKVYFTPSDCIDDSRAFLLAQKLMDAAKQLNIIVVLDVKSADIIIELSYYFEKNIDYKDKKVFIADPEIAFESPLKTLEQAIQRAKPYADYFDKKVASNNIKNIIFVTCQPKNGCPVFELPTIVKKYAQSQNLDIRIEVLNNEQSTISISDENIACADLIFVAGDHIDLTRFKGKPMYQTSILKATNNTVEEFNKALKDARIYTGEHKIKINNHYQETKYGKCAVKKGAHRISFLILLALFIALLLMYLK